MARFADGEVGLGASLVLWSFGPSALATRLVHVLVAKSAKGRRVRITTNFPTPMLKLQRADHVRIWSTLWKRVHIMETIQVVIDAKLLKAADQAARQTKANRSALIRDALREHLKQLKIRELEERERKGYAAQPQRKEEWEPWLAEVVWPNE